MATATLPTSLRSKLTSLARRMAMLRVARIAAGMILVLVLLAALGMAADAALKLPAWLRFGLLGGWCTLAAAGLLRCLRSIGIQSDVDALAALIESQYPNLAERLTTSVELSEAGECGHGSPALIDLLLRETEIRASKLDFLQAAPEKPTYRRAGWAAIAVIVLLAPAMFWPQPYIGQLRRLAMPWSKAPLGYEIVSNPGDAAVARGHALTLSAYLQVNGNVRTLPTHAILVIVEPNGKTTRLAMKNEQPQVFHFKLNSVAEGFRYRVESGEAMGTEHQVAVVDPVQLVGDSPSITVTPPEYARQTAEIKTLTGLGDFSALQHGRLALEYKFTRPAVAARLEWSGTGEHEKAVPLNLKLADDGLSARCESPVKNDGRFKLVLEAEHGIRTELPPQALTVITDRPPAFVKVAGVSEQLRTVSAFDTIPLDLSLLDDYGVETAEIGFRVNEGKPQTEKISFPGLGTTQVDGRYALKLTGRVNEGDTFQFRLKVTDNRRVPEAGLLPQAALHPGEGRWFTMKIARKAEPLKQQEILAQRNDIQQRLDALLEKLRKEEQSIWSRQQEAKSGQSLTPDRLERFEELRPTHQANEKSLSDLARDTAQTPELRSLANRLQDVSDQEMHNAASALQLADRNRDKAPPRAAHLDTARTQVESAIKRLEELKKQNEQLAQQRLDQMKLEQLAERQQQLAEQAKQEVDPKKAQELAREQQRLAEELNKLTEQNEALKQALAEAQARKNQELADKARELAQQQRDLNQAANQTDKDAAKDKLGDLAAKQKELADKAHKLASETERPARAAQTQPLDAEKPRDAADLLEKGDPNAALTKQEQTAQDLDRLANELDRAIQLARDPREAAKQLARLQNDLKNRTTNEAKKTPLNQLDRARLDDLKKDQAAIQQAAENLSVPESNQAAKRDRAEAVEHARKAAEELANKDQTKAEANMALAKSALERLADKLPTLQQRLNAARDEVGKLRRQQDEIARQAENLAKASPQDSPDADTARRELARKLADTARRQADAADRLGKLDLPTLEQRQERTQESMNRALHDLLSGRSQDLSASQADAKRQLERLDQALNGQKPVDEKAAELARRQQQLAQDAAKLNRKPVDANDPEIQRLRNQQQQLAQETARLPQTEAAQRQAEAAEATKQAEKAAQQSPRELAQKAAEAAKALDRLASQLSGTESDAAKADRLARKQTELARDAEQLARKPDAKANDELRKKQQQVQDETRNIRGGEQAASEKRKADDALAQLSRSKPEQTADAQKQAAEALRQLADKLANKSNAERAAELAREQRQLANDAAKAPPMNADARQQAQQAAEKQSDLARRLQRMDAAKSSELAKQAAQQMQQAQKTLEQAKSPSEAQQQLARAAEATEQLAREMDKQQAANDPMKPNQGDKQAPSPSQLAQQQRQLSQQTQEARQQARGQEPQKTQQALRQLAQKQAELGRQAEQMPAGSQQKSVEQARQAMNQAEQALAKGDWEKVKQNQEAAARALDQLARQQPQQAVNRPAQPAAPPNLPNKAQTEQARELAQQQRDLRDAVQKAIGNQNAQNQPMNNPAGDLAKEQRDIADAAQKLAQQQAQQNGQQSPQAQQAQQAARAAQQASNQVQAGAMPQARQSGQQAAQQMQQMAQNNKGEAGQQAGQLAQRQQDVNRQLEQMATNQQAQRAQQQAQQQNLQQQAQQLADQMQQQANQMRGSPSQQAMQQAGQASKQANEAMQQARRSQQQGNPQGTRQGQQQAAQNLDRASQLAQQAANQQAQRGQQPGQGSPQPQTGQALQQAQNQMGNAQQQLGQGQPRQAQGSMQQAAQSLQQAAQSLAQQGQQSGQPPQGPSDPKGNDGSGNAAIDLQKYGKDAAKFQGKAWGELPGELRTRIIQDMKTQYGDDYGRMIKLYFEQIADKKSLTPR